MREQTSKSKQNKKTQKNKCTNIYREQKQNFENEVKRISPVLK